MNRFVRWRSGEYAALWYEAASMKQAKNKSKSIVEALASRAKTLFFKDSLVVRQRFYHRRE